MLTAIRGSASSSTDATMSYQAYQAIPQLNTHPNGYIDTHESGKICFEDPDET